VADLDKTEWTDIERVSGLTRESLEQAAALYAKSEKVIATYGMGITQHNKGTSNVKLIVNLLLMRGNIGKPGAGICPLRGHSNVQGNRTVGITEKPAPEFNQKLKEVFDFDPP
jgi:anaerobic selenocysteine-containing dehydrogenase